MQSKWILFGQLFSIAFISAAALSVIKIFGQPTPPKQFMPHFFSN